MILSLTVSMCRRAWLCHAVASLLLVSSTAAYAQQGGRIAGTVTDASTGRPIAQALIEIPASNVRALSDLAGRFRTVLVPPGTYIVRVSSLGFAEYRVENVNVATGQTATINIALQPQALEVEGVVATATSQRAASAAGLLARQKNAAAVSDGISAEQIARSPDSDAADAMQRVTGISVVDDKFVIVRGLAERYSNTLLNGVELASPEPGKRIVPLDIFPASLLESLVTTKTATPDLPGDFAGGSVNIQTKEFPEERVFEIKVSQGYNSEVNFKSLPILPRQGLRDYLGFDGGGRSRDWRDYPDTPAGWEALAEDVRPVWSGAPQRILPDFGFSVSYGDQKGEFDNAFGYVLSFDYGYKTSYDRSDYFALVDAQTGDPSVETDTEGGGTTVDWGALANGTLRLGPRHTIGLKNLVTRESEEYAMSQVAYDPEAQAGFAPLLRRHQVRYIERMFLQSQLRGQHLFNWPFRTNIQWNAGVSKADRDEPENRTLVYARDAVGYRLTNSETNHYWFRFLDDLNLTGGVDVSIPLPRFFGDTEGLFKTGVQVRQRERDFDVNLYDMQPVFGTPPDGLESLRLDPERVIAPENLGRNIIPNESATGGLPYRADDEVRAAYVMGDLPLPLGLRLVGGVRFEQWLLELVPGDDNPEDDTLYPPVSRDVTDMLWSANLTIPLTDRMNLRAAAYRTTSRPDPRELSQGQYVPVAGKCATYGTPELDRVRIFNGDLRWEWYPSPGELISLSGFVKDFVHPIVEVVSLESLACVIYPRNAESADNRGVEIELRKNLGFLTNALRNFSFAGNFTYVTGSTDIVTPVAELRGLPLQDQSKYLFNGSLLFQTASGWSASVLYNYFDDRVSLYGITSSGQAGAVKQPDIIEQGRSTIDAKIGKRFDRVSVSISGKNLTNEAVRELQLTETEAIMAGYARPGVSISLSLGYAFH